MLSDHLTIFPCYLLRMLFSLCCYQCEYACFIFMKNVNKNFVYADVLVPTLTLKMNTTLVVETSVTVNNSPIQDYIQSPGRSLYSTSTNL